MMHFIRLMLLLGLVFPLGITLSYAQAAEEDVAQEEEMGEEEEDDEEDEDDKGAGNVDIKEAIKKSKVPFRLKGNRDPMLSPEDMLLIKFREQQRLAAEAAERRRKAEEEKRRQAEEEKRRQWELALMRDPTILVRDKIRISGIIDKEVLIDGKLYTIGNFYKGAKIVSVAPESVTFSYKGHKFVKRVRMNLK